MKFRNWVASLIVMLFAMNCFALSAFESENSEELQVNNLVKTLDGLQVSLSVIEPEWSTVSVDNGLVEIASFNNSDFMEIIGEPIVPVTSRFFRLPATGGAILNINNAVYEVISDIDYGIYLGEENGTKLMGASSIPEDRWFPENIAEITDPAIMHDFRISSITTYPIQVNPARRKVRVYSSYDIEISYTGNSGLNELEAQPTRISSLFLNWYRNFMDWNEIELDDFEIYRGDVLVVVHTSMLDVLEPWTQWKRQKGWNIEILTQEDVSWNSNAIKTGIQSRYNESEGTLDYVVIVGDDGTPNHGSEGDHGYTLLAGGDQLSDVALGRISVANESQLVNYVSKTLKYESTPFMGTTEWYKRGMVASGGSGMSTVRLGRQVRNLLLDLGYTQVDSAFFTSHPNPNSIVAQKINEGVSYFNYRGYWGTGLSTGEIAGLTNANMLPMVLDITCGTGDWVWGTSLTEAWMRAGTANHPRGGIAAIGTATTGTHTRFNNSLSSGAFEASLVYHIPEIGAAILGAKYNLYKTFSGFDNGGVGNFNDWCNLMGDPTTWLFTDIPQPLVITYPVSIEEGINVYDVRVSDGSNYLPDAWVTLYAELGGEFFTSTGISDADGRVTLDIPSTDVSTYKLTVTKQNCHPSIIDIPVNGSSRVGYTQVSFQDDNQDGTVGNGNGVPEAGETIGVMFNVHNYDGATQTNVTLAVSASSNMFNVTQATSTIGTIAAGSDVLNSTPILIDIAENAQDRFFDYLNVGFSSDQGDFDDQLKIMVRAPKFSVSTVSVTGDLYPGEDATISLTINNIGGSDFNAGSAIVVSTDPFLNVLDDPESVGSVATGNSVTIPGYSFSAHNLSFRGYQASFRVELESSTGQIDTAYASVNFGNRRAVDPSGPDKYGYFAFDDEDDDYEMSPEYNWIEIDGGVVGNDYNGERLNLNDATEDDDQVVVIQLPFEMQYYGEVFTHMSVTGNGMVGMGIQPMISTARNWPIPAPLGPNYMIAPFWDDRLTSGDAGIYTYYDSDNDRFIIEWSKTKDSNGTGLTTFEIVFYDHMGTHATVSGDNEFLFQYKTVSPTTGAWADIPYFTTGIENGNQTDGIQYNYWNTAYAGAKNVTANSAILFSTLTGLITGTVEGNVTYLTGGAPVEGATVYVGNHIVTTTTDAVGDYTLERVVIGTHTVTAMGPGLNPSTVNNVTVLENETSTADLEVTQPLFELDQETIDLEMRNDQSIVRNLAITNDGDGWLEYDARIDFHGPEGVIEHPEDPVLSLDEPWDELFNFNTATAEIRNRGLTLVGRNFWTCGSNNPDAPANAPNQLYAYDKEGAYLNTFAQPIDDPQGSGFYGLTTDGEYLYGAAVGKLYKMAFDGENITLVDSWEIPVNPARYLEYDPEEGLFWMGDMTTFLYGIDDQGNIVRSLDIPGQIRAIAYYSGEATDQKLYYMSQDFGSDEVNIRKLNTANGENSLVNTLVVDDVVINDANITYRWNPMKWTFIGLFDTQGEGDLVKVWELDENRAWLEIDNAAGVVEANSSTTLPITFNGLDLPDDDYHAWIRIDHNAIQVVSFVRINLTLFTDLDENIVELPTEWKIEAPYPNPFNPTTTVRFSMVESAMVNAKIFNVLGQEVLTVINRRLGAGYHEMSIDGSQLSSGVYFMKFEAGPINSTSKLILLK
jgi:Peptidase family C25/Carboxypeptidase regulatory-like domain/Propeptide_C25/Secretion system C-terminal sorting domain